MLTRILALAAVILSWAWAYEANAGTFSTVSSDTFRSRNYKPSVGTAAPSVGTKAVPATKAPSVGAKAPRLHGIDNPYTPVPLSAITQHKAKPVDAFPKYEPLSLDEFRARRTYGGLDGKAH